MSMRTFKIAALCLATLLTQLSGCGSTPPETRNAELVVTYQGKVVNHRRPTWYNDSQLKAELEKPGQKFLIFGAPWCGGCKNLRKLMAQGNMDNKVIWINVDEQWAGLLAQHYGLKNVPTMFHIGKDGRIDSIKVGPNAIIMHILIHTD